MFLESYCAIFDFVGKMWENVGKFMSGYFFSGSVVAKLDEKGRFVLPQEMRYGLVEEGKCEFTIGLGLGGCLAIYKKSVISKIVAKFQQSQHVARFQKFFTLFFSTLHQTECDKVGRIMLPAMLKNTMKIQKEIVIVGVMDKIELWPKEVYDENLRNLMERTSADFSLAKMQEEVFGLLNETDKKESEPVENILNPLFAPH